MSVPIEKWPDLDEITLRDGDYLFTVKRGEGSVLVAVRGRDILHLKRAAVQSLIQRLQAVDQLLVSPVAEERVSRAETPREYPPPDPRYGEGGWPAGAIIETTGGPAKKMAIHFLAERYEDGREWDTVACGKTIPRNQPQRVTDFSPRVTCGSCNRNTQMRSPPMPWEGTAVSEEIDVRLMQLGDAVEWESYGKRRGNKGPRSGARKPVRGTVVAHDPSGCYKVPVEGKEGEWTGMMAHQMKWAHGYTCVRNSPVRHPGSTKTLGCIGLMEPGSTAFRSDPPNTFGFWLAAKAGPIVRREDGRYSAPQKYGILRVWRDGKLVWRRRDKP